MHTIDLETDTAQFFQERLAGALRSYRIEVEPPTEMYLVQLLAGYAQRPVGHHLARPLVEQLAAALDAPSERERFRRFRTLGDSALYVCGFFADHLARRGISREYFVAMGGRAYDAAADLAGRAARGDGGAPSVFPTLASRFDTFALVLDEVRESTSLRTPQDIVRLYDRWRQTGSPVLARRLQKEGVFPQGGDDRVLH